MTASEFYDWRQRYGCVNEHNGWVPRDFWLEPWEKEAIIEFRVQNPLEKYRRLTFMMLASFRKAGHLTPFGRDLWLPSIIFKPPDTLRWARPI